ncbi:MAG TPA: DoxX family protein [Candidatus Eisenbacteria bacterium]|nr:DoxX family protein [Candidatus Eisenbacteria bacterium]
MKNADEISKSVGLLLLRAGTGGLLLYAHGWGKITHFSERAATFADPIGLGSWWSFALVVLAEVFCSAALILGLATRLAAIPIVIFSLVAVFVQHAADPFAKKELPLLYMIPALTLLLTGPGRFSIDALFARKRAPRTDEIAP